MLQAVQTLIGLLAFLDLLAILGLLWLLSGSGWAGTSIILPGLGLVVSSWLVLLLLVGVEALLLLALVSLFR